MCIFPLTRSTLRSSASAGRPYLDFGARLYDPRTAAWLSQGPMAEFYYNYSPYSYSVLSPISYVDQNGLSVTDTLRITPSIIVADKPCIDMTDLAYDMLPMVPFADKASIAWNNKQYSRWVGNMLLGTIDGLLFITSMGTSSEFRIVSSLSKPTFSLKRWEHIILRLFPSSGAKNAGKFLKQYSGHDIKSMIETAVKKGSCEPNTKGRSGYR